MKKVSGKIKLQLAQFRELEAFMQFASDLDEETKKQIDAGRRMTEVLNQGRGAPLPFELEAAIIFAATAGYLDAVAPEDVKAIEVTLRDYLTREAGGILEAIRQSKEIRDETDKSLRQKLDAFVARYVAKKEEQKARTSDVLAQNPNPN
jgi:F-type H+-transporting ATPase subunit alpha